MSRNSMRKYAISLLSYVIRRKHRKDTLKVRLQGFRPRSPSLVLRGDDRAMNGPTQPDYVRRWRISRHVSVTETVTIIRISDRGPRISRRRFLPRLSPSWGEVDKKNINSSRSLRRQGERRAITCYYFSSVFPAEKSNDIE